MKNAKKSDGVEPTIKDVMGAVQDLTEAVQIGFEKVEDRFAQHKGILTTLHEDQEQLRELLNERTSALDKRISDTQNRVENIADMLEETTLVVNKVKAKVLH